MVEQKDWMFDDFPLCGYLIAFERLLYNPNFRHLECKNSIRLSVTSYRMLPRDTRVSD